MPRSRRPKIGGDNDGDYLLAHFEQTKEQRLPSMRRLWTEDMWECGPDVKFLFLPISGCIQFS
jgi:hypothetical protein